MSRKRDGNTSWMSRGRAGGDDGNGRVFVSGEDRVDCWVPYDAYLRQPAVAEGLVRSATRMPLPAPPRAGVVVRDRLSPAERADLEARVAALALRAALHEFWEDVALHLLLANVPAWVEREVAAAVARLRDAKLRRVREKYDGRPPAELVRGRRVRLFPYAGAWWWRELRGGGAAGLRGFPRRADALDDARRVLGG